MSVTRLPNIAYSLANDFSMPTFKNVGIPRSVFFEVHERWDSLIAIEEDSN
jgi:hypothetical protein